jgi:hypothetical protein
MARDIPEAYVPPDPDRSFVPGTGRIDYGSGNDSPPHGPADLAKALRHLFGYGAAGLLVPQMWNDVDALAVTSVGFGADPSMVWRFPHDPAFTRLRVTIDYRANAAIVAAFRVRLDELNKERDFNTVDAGGALRRVAFDWTPAGFDSTYGGDFHTVQFFAQGDGAEACDVVGVWIERLPSTDPIPQGRWYNAEFVPPDSSAFAADRPLATDKFTDMINGIGALRDYRLKVYLQWSAVLGHSIGASAILSTLAQLRPDDNRVSTGWIWIGGIGTSVNVFGGRDGLESDERYTASVADQEWKDFALRLEANPLIGGRQSLQQMIVDPSVGPYLHAVSLFGL